MCRRIYGAYMLTTRVMAPRGAKSDMGAKPNDTRSHTLPPITMAKPPNHNGLVKYLSDCPKAERDTARNRRFRCNGELQLS